MLCAWHCPVGNDALQLFQCLAYDKDNLDSNQGTGLLKCGTRRGRRRQRWLGPKERISCRTATAATKGRDRLFLDECKANAENLKESGNTKACTAVWIPQTPYMKCICNYQSCPYDQGEQRQKLPAQGDLLSSIDWAREPCWDLAFSAHRSSVCSRLAVAADSSSDASQLRGHRISSPPASSPLGDGARADT